MQRLLHPPAHRLAARERKIRGAHLKGNLPFRFAAVFFRISCDGFHMVRLVVVVVRCSVAADSCLLLPLLPMRSAAYNRSDRTNVKNCEGKTAADNKSH